MKPIKPINHLYSKKEIDTRYHRVLFDKCSVVLTKPPDDIMDIKSKQKLPINHLYSKKEIDTRYHRVLFDKCSVVLTKPPDDIMDIKSKQKLPINHLYSKKEIDTRYHRVLFDTCSVVLTKPPDDIMDIKSKQKLKLAVENVEKLKTICNTKKKPSILQEKTYVSSTSEFIPTNKCFVATSTDSQSPLAQVTAPLLETTILMPTATTFVASQP